MKAAVVQHASAQSMSSAIHFAIAPTFFSAKQALAQCSDSWAQRTQASIQDCNFSLAMVVSLLYRLKCSLGTKAIPRPTSWFLVTRTGGRITSDEVMSYGITDDDSTAKCRLVRVLLARWLKAYVACRSPFTNPTGLMPKPS